MKKLIMSMIAALAVSTAMAQTDATTPNGDQKKMNPTEMVQKRTDRMVQKYGLSTEQAAKLKTLNEKYMGKMGGARNGHKGQNTENASDSNNAKKGNKGGNKGGHDMSAYNTELKAILTEDQYKSYETDMANRKQHAGQRRNNSSN